MKKTFLKLLLVPAICTALTACDDVVDTSSSNINTSSTSAEVTSEISSEVNSETTSEVSTTGIVPVTDEDQAVINILNSYKDGNKLEEAFSSGFSIGSTSTVKIDMDTENKIVENNDITFSTDFVNTSLVNSYIGEEESSLYVESSMVGDVAVTDYYIDYDGDEETYQEGLNTDFDLTGKAEISEATYVMASGKLPSDNFQPVDAMTEETSEELEARSNYLFEGYSELDYAAYISMIDGLINGTEEEPVDMEAQSEDTEDEQAFPILDLEDEEVYLGIYNFLTGRDENGLIDTSIDLNSDGTITFDFDLDLNQINLLGAYGGDVLISAIEQIFGAEEGTMMDELTMYVGGLDKKFEVSLTLDEEYLPYSFDMDINLDDTQIVMTKEVESDEGTESMDYTINLNEMKVEFESDFTFGSEVEKLGFTDEEKDDIEENGDVITEFINDGYTTLTNLLIGIV